MKLHKKSALIILLFLIIYIQLNLEHKSNATQIISDSEKAYIRVGIHPDFSRIVFTVSSEDLSKKASVSLTDNKLIKVTFSQPLLFAIKKQESESIIMKGEGFIEIAKEVKVLAGSNFCIIQVEKIENYKLTKMNNPARIVIDAYRIKDKQISENIKPSIATKERPIRITFNNIAIDPGHGGYDKGIYDENNREKDIVLNISKEISRILSREGKKILLTRKSDHRISIKERISLVNARTPDIFISIHISSQAEGVIYTYAEKDDTVTDNTKIKIANDVASNMVNIFKKDLGLNFRHETLPLPLLRNIKSPALLIELPNFRNFSYDKIGTDALIKSIINGLTIITATD